MMKKATQSESKSCDHSNKLCVCGGHSAKDVKKNKHHNATKKKLERRIVRKLIHNLNR